MSEINDMLDTLKFLKAHVFTEQNIQRAAEIGKTMGQLLADAYALVAEMQVQANSGTRSLDLERRIEAAGLTALVRDMQKHPF